MLIGLKRMLVLATLAAWGLSGPAVASEEGDAVRASLEAHEMTKPKRDDDRRGDVEYMAVFRAEESLYLVRKVKLIGDLWRAEPDAPELADLMSFRWKNANRIYGLDLEAEIEAFAEARPDAADAVANGWYQVASVAAGRSSRDPDKAAAAAESFITRYPEDERGSNLLYSAARGLPDADPRKAEFTQRLLDQYPDSRYGKRVATERKRDAAVGQPFEMSFTDYMTGETLSMADLRGQVVVIDFWAVWCGPCKASLPHLKELYALHHESGLEIIGVSLDKDPQTMIDFCKENDMTWPQYCEEGKVWDTEFSTGWGISAIPSMFIIDRNGILRDVKARGKLDELIPELLGEPAPK